MGREFTGMVMIPTLPTRPSIDETLAAMANDATLNAAMRLYDEADKHHEAGRFSRARYLREWGDRAAMGR
jgi:hypothetical protein